MQCPSFVDGSGGSVPLLPIVSEWIEGSGRLLVLLGDFGTGKTTFLKHLKHKTAIESLNGRDSLLPVLGGLARLHDLSARLAVHETTELR